MLNESTPQAPPYERLSFLALIGATGRLCSERAGTFAALAAGALGVQLVLLIAIPVPHGMLVVPTIVLPVLVTATYAIAAAARASQPVARSAVWERVLERSWAVILIDFFIVFLTAIAIGSSLQSDWLDRVLGVVALLYTATLVFADAIATIVDDVSFWALLPTALWMSVRIAWTPGTFIRTIWLLCIGLLLTLAQNEIFHLLTLQHVGHADVWAEIPLATFATVPLSVLVLLVYVDALRARVSDRGPAA